MERNESDGNGNDGKGEDKFVLEYPENYNEIVEGMLRKVERECEYIKKFEIKEGCDNGKSKENLKEGGENNDNNDNDDEENESSDNDNHQYMELNEEGDDDDNNHTSVNNNNNNEQQLPTNNSYQHNNNTYIISPPSSQHITQTPPTNNPTQPNINSSKIKQMLSKVNMPPPSWASSLSDDAFLNLILPSLSHPPSSPPTH